MNSYNFTGRLTNDPVSRETSNGVVATFRVAVDKPARLYVDAWGRLAAIAGRLSKRRHVAISGYWDQRQYHDPDGNKKERNYVVAEHIGFLDSPTSMPVDDAAAATAER